MVNSKSVTDFDQEKEGGDVVVQDHSKAGKRLFILFSSIFDFVSKLAAQIEEKMPERRDAGS